MKRPDAKPDLFAGHEPPAGPPPDAATRPRPVRAAERRDAPPAPKPAGFSPPAPLRRADLDELRALLAEEPPASGDDLCRWLDGLVWSLTGDELRRLAEWYLDTLSRLNGRDIARGY